ncbi:MAG: hypothetical protein ACYDG2_22685, partial [Ruminiclostridium sp.]
MNNELRIIDYTVFEDEIFKNNITKYKNVFETISFGSESCYRQLPSIERIKKIIDNTRDFK